MRGAANLAACMVAISVALAGCSDDTTKTTPEGSESLGEADTSSETLDPTETGDTSDTTVNPTDTSDTGDTSDTSDTGETGDTGDTGDTGEPDPDIPQSAMDLASASVITYSPNYTMVLTLGQPTLNQNSMASPSYRLEGGTVRTTGTQP